MTAPRLVPAFRATVAIGAPLDLGAFDGARRRIIPILGGEFSGDRVSGRVLPGGADWQTLRADGATEVLARYTLEAADGALIAVTNAGVRRGPPDVLARIAAGEDVDPALYYFRTTPRFEVAASSVHAWLGASMFVATAERYGERVVLDVFEVE